MSEKSIVEVMRMYNGFAKEGILVHFGNEALQRFNHLYNENPRAIVIPIKAYLELRDNRIFDR